MLSAARALDDLDDELARETYLEALTAAMYAGRLGAPGLLAEVAAAGARAVARVRDLQRPVDHLLKAGIRNACHGGFSRAVYGNW